MSSASASFYDRANHRNMNNSAACWKPMPLYGGISAIILSRPWAAGTGG